jgi:hypothetical protein
MLSRVFKQAESVLVEFMTGKEYIYYVIIS